MTSHYHFDRLVTISLSCQAINAEYSHIAEQLYILTDAFEKRIKFYNKNQLLFFKAFLSLHKSVEQKGLDSFIHYQLFLLEQQLKRIA